MGLSRTVSEIDGDFSRNSQNFPTPCILRPQLTTQLSPLSAKFNMPITLIFTSFYRASAYNACTTRYSYGISVRPMPVRCLNERTHRQTLFDILVGASF